MHKFICIRTSNKHTRSKLKLRRRKYYAKRKIFEEKKTTADN